MFRNTAATLMLSTALTAGAAWAQTTTTPTSPAAPAAPAPMSTPAPTPSTTTTPMATPSAASTASSAATAGKVVTEQGMNEFRVSKFVGVDIYGSENQKIGDITEILIDANGTAKTVVIGVGGFLGIGQKNVAVPFSGVEWKLQPMTTTSTTPATTATGAATTASTAPARSPAETAAYNGYPDHGVVKMTRAELQDAPTFKYVADMGTASATSTATPPATTAPRQ